MKVAILGAAGEIGRFATTYFLDQTDVELVLYARNASHRLKEVVSERVTLVDGDFTEKEKLEKAVTGVDVVYLSFVAGEELMSIILSAIEKAGVNRFIVASVPDIYQEVEGPFQSWYREHTGLMWTSSYRKAIDLVEQSNLDYTILRITWLYNAENRHLHVTRKGQAFRESQVTRQAVAQFVVDLVTEKEDYHRDSLGLGEKDTDFTEPRFY